MLKSSEGHVWLGDSDVALRADLLAILSKGSSLLGHRGEASVVLGNLGLGLNSGWLCDRDLGNAHSFGLHDAGFEG